MNTIIKYAAATLPSIIDAGGGFPVLPQPIRLGMASSSLPSPLAIRRPAPRRARSAWRSTRRRSTASRPSWLCGC